MGQSTAVCYLYCSRCKRESMKSPKHGDRDFPRNYLNVVVVSVVRDGSAALCKCNKCGHTYTSTSKAAKRAMRFVSA